MNHLVLPTVLRAPPLRHSIVDLSANETADGANSNASARNPLRRPVASKRRPSASMRAMRTPVSDTTSSNAPAISGSSAEATEQRAATEPPGCRLVLKDHGGHADAIYEPVVTFRALSAFRPLFHRCVQYMETHAEDLRASGDADMDGSNVESGAGKWENRITNMTNGLREAASTFLLQLKQLEELDDSVMRAIHDIEHQHFSLFQQQLIWCSEHHSKVSSEEESYQFVVDPWDSASIQALELLKEKESKVKELSDSATELCVSLDALMASNLAAVVALIEEMAPSKPGQPRLLSSLQPHPSLLRKRRKEAAHVSDTHNDSDDDKMDDSKPEQTDHTMDTPSTLPGPVVSGTDNFKLLGFDFSNGINLSSDSLPDRIRFTPSPIQPSAPLSSSIFIPSISPCPPNSPPSKSFTKPFSLSPDSPPSQTTPSSNSVTPPSSASASVSTSAPTEDGKQLREERTDELICT